MFRRLAQCGAVCRAVRVRVLCLPSERCQVADDVAFEYKLLFENYNEVLGIRPPYAIQNFFFVLNLKLEVIVLFSVKYFM